MLTLTDNAATVIGRLVTRADRGSDAGLRIQANDEAAGAMDVQIVATPEAGDDVVEQAGARVYLDSTASESLSSKRLDARVEKDAVNFIVNEQ